MSENNDYEFLIYVPNASNSVAEGEFPPDEVEQHALETIKSVFRGVIGIRVEDVEQQWNHTLDTVMRMQAAVAKRTGDWQIDEMEVGLTLSAKGQLLFIAEGGAEASIKIKLKPK